MMSNFPNLTGDQGVARETALSEAPGYPTTPGDPWSRRDPFGGGKTASSALPSVIKDPLITDQGITDRKRREDPGSATTNPGIVAQGTAADPWNVVPGSAADPLMRTPAAAA